MLRNNIFFTWIHTRGETDGRGGKPEINMEKKKEKEKEEEKKKEKEKVEEKEKKTLREDKRLKGDSGDSSHSGSINVNQSMRHFCCWILGLRIRFAILG